MTMGRGDWEVDERDKVLALILDISLSNEMIGNQHLETDVGIVLLYSIVGTRESMPPHSLSGPVFV